MHPCLNVQEIVANIFESFSYDTIIREGLIDRVVDRKLLTGLARTCKAFSEPALAALWHTQNSLVPLIRCLPSDALKIDAKRYIVSVTRELKPSDFDRINRYSKLIQAFNGEGDTVYVYRGWRTCDLALPLVLSRRNSPGPILPSIKRIQNLLLAHFDGLCLYPRLIVGPTVHSVQITINDDDYQQDRLEEYPWDNLILGLQGLAASLTDLKISTTDRNYLTLNYGKPIRLTSLLSAIGSLQKLNVPFIYIDSTTFIHLSTMPFLEFLNVAIDSAELTKVLQQPKNTTSFPKLKELALQTDSLDPCVNLLKRDCFRSLQAIELLRNCKDFVVWDLTPLFHSLHKHHSHTELQTLRILDNGYLADIDTVTHITPDTLRPLLMFLNMVEFTITLDATFSLDDEFLMEIARKWVNLRSFHLFDRSTTTPATGVPFLTFLSFVAQCAKLEEVTLLMNAYDLPGFHQLRDFKPCLNFRRLDVSTSPANGTYTDITAMVAILTMAFPNLSELSYGWYYMDPREVEIEFELTPQDKLHAAFWRKVYDTMRPAMLYHH